MNIVFNQKLRFRPKPEILLSVNHLREGRGEQSAADGSSLPPSESEPSVPPSREEGRFISTKTD